MRTVVNREQVAHLFANQSQDHARTSSHNFYFRGVDCWSYGSHFLAARHYGDVVLMNADTYSNTTARQLSALRSACSHLDVIEVSNPAASSKPEHRENLRILEANYQDKIAEAGRARKYGPMLFEQAERMLTDANRYAEYFKLGRRIKAVDVEQAKQAAADRRAKWERANARQIAAAEKQRAERIAKDKAEYADKLAAWRNGHGSAYNLGNYRGSDSPRLRLTEDGETVQTTHGAEFPAADARRFIGFVLSCFEAGRDWSRNGDRMPLGQFQIDKIDSNAGLLRAGCHVVERAEIEHLAGLLNG